MKPRPDPVTMRPMEPTLGFRSLEAAERLVDGGFVKPSYGRKKTPAGDLAAPARTAAIPVESHAQSGHAIQLPGKARHRAALLETSPCGSARRRRHARQPRAASSCKWLRIARSHESPTTNRCAARRLDAGRVPWRSGAPEEPGGPTSQPGARRRDTGHPGAKRWRPRAMARGPFQGPDLRGGGRGSNGGAVCLVSCLFSGCHPAFKSLILRDWA